MANLKVTHIVTVEALAFDTLFGQVLNNSRYFNTSLNSLYKL